MTNGRNKIEAIGKRIKTLRKSRNISAEELAQAIGVSPATIYRYESADIANMGIDKIEPLAGALHTTPEFLMGWTDDSVNYEDGDLVASVPTSYLELFDGDVHKALTYMKQVDAENSDSSLSNPNSVKTPEEERMLLLARKAVDIPKEQRDKIIKTFEDTIDLYLEAQGLKKKEDT